MKKGNLKKETDSTIKSAQDQAPCTRKLRNAVYGENVQSICRVCGAADEKIAHIVSECSKLAQKEYKQMRHDNIVKMLHWKLCEKWGFNKVEKWYIHKPDQLLDSEDCKILRDFPVQTDKTLEHNRSNITIIEKTSKKCLLIDPTCPFDIHIEAKEEGKCRKYSELRSKLEEFGK